MLPYYLKSDEYKLIHAAESIRNPFGAFTHNEGWLPSYMHNIIRGIMGMIYGIWIIYVLVKFRHKQPGLSKLYPGLSRWLWVFGTMMFIFGFIVSYTLFLGSWENPQNQALFMTIVFSTSQIITGFVLFMHPACLYGMPRLSGFSEHKNDALIAPGAIPVESGTVAAMITDMDIEQPDKYSNEDALLIEIYQAYKVKLEILMKEKQPYLKEHYKVSDLAKDLGIPQHHVTILLNRILNVRFNDYINRYRIQHIKLLIEKNGPSHTLEGFANMAGFSNRTTFIRAVQRVTGLSPSQYFLDKNS
jgi:AraC-like DNA-binding protein